MNLLPILLLFVAVIYIESKEVLLPNEGSYTFQLKADSIGLVRKLRTESEELFYFCDKVSGDKKKNCGAWVDKKGEKIQHVSSKTSVTKTSAVISKLDYYESGQYGVLPEDKNAKKAEAARVELNIEQLPLNGK